MLCLCDAVQTPLKPEKVIGPSTQMIILGIELDTVLVQAQLPQDKLQSLLEELELFVSLHLTDTSCTKRQLLSLVGKLAWDGFLTWLTVTPPWTVSLIHISDEALQDVLWWKKFASSWNGVAFFLDPTWTPASELKLYNDASGTLGFGGYWNGAWFSQPWPPHLAAKPIEWKELYAIVIAACEVWGSRWSGKRILFHCDNLAIVRIWESGLSRCSDLMYLVRALFLVAAHNNFNVLIWHVLGTNNCIADALSRLRLPLFRALAPEARPYPTPIPANLTFYW